MVHPDHDRITLHRKHALCMPDNYGKDTHTQLVRKAIINRVPFCFNAGLVRTTVEISWNIISFKNWQV